MINMIKEYFNKRRQYAIDLQASSDAPRLHGVNLKQWHYLGLSTISFAYTDDTRVDTAYLFFFCSRNDEDLRKYVLITDNISKYLQDKFDHHPWIIEKAELWIAGERKLYDPINKEPSLYLKDKMLEEYKVVWSTEKNWWVSNEDAKYQSAKKTQAKKKPKEEPEVTTVEDNVVKIEFKKDKNE